MGTSPPNPPRRADRRAALKRPGCLRRERHPGKFNQTFSKTLNFALRLLGFAFLSSQVGIKGDLVTRRKGPPFSWNLLTIRSSVEWKESLPRNASGKVLKTELREPFWQGHSRRVH